MIYVIKCQVENILIPSLKIKLKKGDSFECPKRLYDTNREIKTLVTTGVLSSHPKLPIVKESKSKGLVARVGVPKVPIQEPQQQVIHKTEVHHHDSQVDLDDLVGKLLEKLSGVLSPEMIAQAVASQLPQQQTIVQQSPTATQTYQAQQTEEMTFIPSKILSDDVKSSSASTVNETSGEDTSLSDAMNALKAMRKAQK
jgi:hypothetical protein